MYEYFHSGGPAPYCLLDFSLTLWTICLVLGWAKAAKAMNAEGDKERAADKAEAEARALAANPNARTCIKVKQQDLGADPGWLLRFDSRVTWPFKALYWFSLGYVNAIIIMVTFACLAYTLYTVAGHSKYLTYKFMRPRMNGGVQLPAIFSSRWLLASFDEAFTWNHLAIFLASYIALVVIGIVWLKPEMPRGTPEYESQQELRAVNRSRMLFMHTVAGACIDSCYTLLGFYFMVLPTPGSGSKYDEDALKEYRRIKEGAA